MNEANEVLRNKAMLIVEAERLLPHWLLRRLVLGPLEGKQLMVAFEERPGEERHHVTGPA